MGAELFLTLAPCGFRAVASERLALTASGQVRYTLKTPYRDGTTRVAATHGVVLRDRVDRRIARAKLQQ